MDNLFQNKLVNWSDLRKKLNKRPAFINGTSIKIKHVDGDYPWKFSRCPIVCDVSSCSLEEYLIFLMHVLSFNLQRRKTKISELPKLVSCFSKILVKILSEPDLLYGNFDDVVTVINLFTVMVICCVQLLTPRNISILRRGTITLDDILKKANSVMEIINSDCPDGHLTKVLRAASHNLINRLEERTEVISQLENFDCKIVQEEDPSYCSQEEIFSNIQEKIFSRHFYSLYTDFESENVISFTKTRVNVRPSEISRYMIPIGIPLQLSESWNCKTIVKPEINENLRKLDKCFNSEEFVFDEENFYRILNTFISSFWPSCEVLGQRKVARKQFPKQEVTYIFLYLIKLIRICRKLPFHLDHTKMLNEYLGKIYDILNSQLLCDILPHIDVHYVVIASLAIHDLISETDEFKPHLTKLLLLVSKIAYLLSSSMEISEQYSVLDYSAFGSGELLNISTVVLYRYAQDLNVGEQKVWNQLLSADKVAARLAGQTENGAECIVCIDKIVDKNFYVLPCTHSPCERCVEKLIDCPEFRLVWDKNMLEIHWVFSTYYWNFTMLSIIICSITSS